MPAPMIEKKDRNQGNEPKKHILIVDDDPEIVETFEFALSRNGYRVLVAKNGNEAVVLTETKKPDLMILDLMLPKRSGFLVLEHLRQKTTNPIPVIVVTANDGRRHRDYVEMLGIEQYFCKPVSIETLLDAIEKSLDDDQFSEGNIPNSPID